MVVGFSKMVSETNDLAGQRELIAEYLQTDVLRPMHDLIKWTQTERKKLMQEGSELHRTLKENMDMLERVSCHSLSESLSVVIPEEGCITRARIPIA